MICRVICNDCNVDIVLPDGQKVASNDFLNVTRHDEFHITSTYIHISRYRSIKLIVDNFIRLRDDVEYKCVSSDSLKKKVNGEKKQSIKFVANPYLNLLLENSTMLVNLPYKGSKSAVIRFSYDGDPRPHFEWYDNHGRFAFDFSEKKGFRNSNYVVNVSSVEVVVQINDVQFYDAGNYSLVARTLRERKASQLRSKF